MKDVAKVAAVSYIEREDGRLLCVWNQRYGGWSLPGGMVEPGEPVEVALARELKEETGCILTGFVSLYKGPHGIANEDNSRASLVYIFRVQKTGEPREMELGCPVTWLTREQFLKWSPFTSFYEKVFAAVPPGRTFPEKEV
jgi:8-oxo-dGTP pyrophosphatase MutT (NUDIX family)